jgi:predicted ester cyclase
MSTKSNMQIARLIIEEGLSRHNLALLDQYFDPDFIENQFGLKSTLAGMKADFQYLYRAFPDYRLDIEDMTADQDKVWLRMQCTGTNQGGFLGQPNGRSFRITVMDVIRLKDGRVVEHWGVPDRFAILMQLGILPKPESGEWRS